MDPTLQLHSLQRFEAVTAKSSGRCTLVSIAATTFSLLVWITLATVFTPEGNIHIPSLLVGLLNLITVGLTLRLIHKQRQLHQSFLALISRYQPADRDAYARLFRDAKPRSLLFWRQAEAWLAQERHTLQQRC